MVGLSCLSQPLSTRTTPDCRSEFGENGCLRGLQPSRAVHCCPSGKLSCSVRPRLAHVVMDVCVRIANTLRNLGRFNGWGALHLGNGSESQRSDSSYALPHSWAVHSLNQTVRTPSRSGDGALPNSTWAGVKVLSIKCFTYSRN